MREGGREEKREGGREGRRGEGGREGEREGGREGGREGRREGGRERGREGGREGLTFSPISVWSPPGRISRSGPRAHAVSVSLYRTISFGRPNRMLFWSVSFCIQAC